MHQKGRVPDGVVRRLPGYYRYLRELEAEGVIRLSSQTLGERMGLTPSQIRHDINYFGGFGHQGYGYHVPNLKRRIGQILGVDREHWLVIVGAGNIGSAVALYPTFRNEGFRIQALFDISRSRIGKNVGNVPILPVGELENYLAEHPIDIVVIATPAESAQEITHIAARAGVRAIWNFAPVDLETSGELEVLNVHLSDGLMALSFRLHEREVLRQEYPQWIKE
ncbi:MAG: redox-sensing transcriptional repressor Rex [Firmicutes bacterium]|nr:redox-sensing transcriptional repressor Rex [Bacillota bacterium]